MSHIPPDWTIPRQTKKGASSENGPAEPATAGQPDDHRSEQHGARDGVERQKPGEPVPPAAKRHKTLETFLRLAPERVDHEHFLSAATNVGTTRRQLVNIIRSASSTRLDTAEAVPDPDPSVPSASRQNRPKGLEFDTLLSRLPYKAMLKDLFGGMDLMPPNIPYVCKDYEEHYMRECMYSHERQCANGNNCECMFIDKSEAFVATEFLLPWEDRKQTPNLCVVCHRAVSQQLFYDIMFDEGCVGFQGVIQRYGNIHSQTGEYDRDACLICPPSGPLSAMPLPLVSHQRNRYTVYRSNGFRHLRQHRVHFQQAPAAPSV